MATYNEHAGQPRATADDGLVLILTEQNGERWFFDFDLPGTGSGNIKVELDPEGSRLYVTTYVVTIPASGGQAEEQSTFSGLGAPLRRRLQDSLVALLQAWPALSWSGRRCIFQ